MTLSLWLELEARITNLANKGANVCEEFKPDDMNLSCVECHYTSDVHLIKKVYQSLIGKFSFN